MLKKTIVFILFLSISILFAEQKDIDQKVEELLAKMTNEEKIGQLVQYSGYTDDKEPFIRTGQVGSFLNVHDGYLINMLQKIALEESRLGIPLIFGTDAIHGYSTIFPSPIAEACTWDPELIEKESQITAKETRASGIFWTFAPMVDIARDPRWGRIVEGAGEDPYLGSLFSAARVRGFQGEDLSSENSILACLKHYVAYGGAIAGKDYNAVDMSERTLREIYLPPFKAGVEEGALSVMSAFNTLNGIPATANKFTLIDILRNEWGFKGFVLSDWDAIGQLVTHGYAENKKDAALKAFTAGVDMDMQTSAYHQYLLELVNEKKISIEMIDRSVKSIIKVKYLLGLFDDPYVDLDKRDKILFHEDHLKLAREIAQRSMVLLKNQNNLLPLKKNTRKIALIGPLGLLKEDHLGSWRCQGEAKDVVNILEGLQNKLPKASIQYSRGCSVEGTSKKEFKDAIKLAKLSDVVILALGEHSYMSGEAASKAHINLPGIQNELVKEIIKVNRKVIVLLINGRPLSINWLNENVPAILETWQLGHEAGNAIADVLFGDYNPSGKLVVSFPHSEGQIPIYYNHENTGRPPSSDKWTAKYIDEYISPLYPFGFGLSYSTFQYSNMKINKHKIKIGNDIIVSADIENTGKYDGEEIVQLYIRDITASIVRPVKELKGFKKIFLKTGEKQNVEFKLSSDDLSFLGQDMERIVEPGSFKIWISWNSQKGLEETFELVE